MERKFLIKRNGKEIEEEKVDTTKYDLIYYSNKELKDLGFGSIDTNYRYIMLNNIHEVENFAVKFVNEFDLDYLRGAFLPAVRFLDCEFIINNKCITFSELLKMISEDNFKSQYELITKVIEVFKELKDLS